MSRELAFDEDAVVLLVWLTLHLARIALVYRDKDEPTAEKVKAYITEQIEREYKPMLAGERPRDLLDEAERRVEEEFAR